jgi:hypothetical protein
VHGKLFPRGCRQENAHALLFPEILEVALALCHLLKMACGRLLRTAEAHSWPAKLDLPTIDSKSVSGRPWMSSCPEVGRPGMASPGRHTITAVTLRPRTQQFVVQAGPLAAMCQGQHQMLRVRTMAVGQMPPPAVGAKAQAVTMAVGAAP